MASNLNTSPPSIRNLKGYAFDPGQSLNLDTVGINEIIFNIPWETNLKPGPEGEYIKVLDRDPSCDCVYWPVDLNSKNIIATDGLMPSVSNPQFHQQMVYAVAMNTIRNFEKAIGRKVMWSAAKMESKTKAGKTEIRSEFVRQLLIYPHALREANAYYSPDRKALLFGYFNATPANAGLYMPGSPVFSCLSHDIVAHETTHAILDGVFKHYMDQTHPDVAAFHEAFADIVALFQHFTFPAALKNQIAKTSGRLDTENLLGQLAVEFGIASGGYSALRDGIGKMEGEKWVRAIPDLKAYEEVTEPHDRGSILVGAVFDVFMSIYKQRIADLLRIATNGTGVLPEGSLQTDLVTRLANEASRAASHVLNMCIRALDYCPPVDITFGDYLRAIITADVEIVANDARNYRIAFIDAFRRRGIYPIGTFNLSVEALTYTVDEQSEMFTQFSQTLNIFLREFKNHVSYETDREKIFDKTNWFIAGQVLTNAGNKKEEIKGLHEYFFRQANATKKNLEMFENLTGLIFSQNFNQLNISQSKAHKKTPAIEIHSIRLNNRVGPDNALQNQAIITLSQRCGVNIEYDESHDKYEIKTFDLSNVKKLNEPGSFIFRGGCTLIFDLNSLDLKHVISKPIIDMTALHGGKRLYSVNRERAIMQFRSTWGDVSDMTGFALVRNEMEPFACIHKPKPETL